MAAGGDDGGFKFEEKDGDLFACPETDSLAHCVSADLRMGKGIAVKFKNKFRSVEELKKQEKKIGQVTVLEKEQRFIYYLITKAKATEKPTCGNLKASLEDMKKHCVAHDVQTLAMPELGCGLDRLKWEEVKTIICEVFAKTNIHITVYVLESQKNYHVRIVHKEIVGE